MDLRHHAAHTVHAALMSMLLGLAACSDSSAPAGGTDSDAFVPAPGGPFAVKADHDADVGLCLLPGGTIGTPEPVILDPLPDSGNGLAADAVTDAPTDLPRGGFVRGDTETYNRRYDFALRDGRIWYRSHAEVTGIVQPWDALAMPACLEGTIIGISVDDDELIAIRTDGAIYGMDNAFKDPLTFNWSSRWGPPVWTGTGHNIGENYLAWSWTVISPAEDKNWTDPAGNLHAIGQGKVSHIWMLGGDGQDILYIDPWLPRDESYGMCGPEGGRLQLVNLSSSGSTVVGITRYGDIYTRHYDFDLAGADNVFFTYSYEDQRGVASPAIQLPSFDWVRQPRVPGRITHHIGIHKVGENMIHRVLRVEGLDSAGHSGFWQRDIAAADNDWTFTRTDAPLKGTLLSDPGGDTVARALGPSPGLDYGYNLAALPTLGEREHVEEDTDWAAELIGFSTYCSPTTLRIHVAPNQSFDLLLHTTDVIRQTERARGLDDNPRSFRGAIEIPQALYDSLATQPPKVQEFVALYLGPTRFTEVNLSGVTGTISFDDQGWAFTRPQ